MKKIQALSIFSFIILSTFTNCTKVDEDIWFTKNETYCAEAWHNEPWITQEQDENAKTWLEMQGVTVLVSEYDAAAITPEVCLACSCLSGGVHRVQTNAEFTDTMISEGFVIE